MKHLPVSRGLALTVFAFCVLPLTAARAQDSYSWVGKDGRVYYGNTPPKEGDSVTKLHTKTLSRYSSDKMLKRLGVQAANKAQHASAEQRKQPLRETTPAHLEQAELHVDVNDKGQVISCIVSVRNTGTKEAKEVSVAFDFPDGTLLPGVGPETIAPNAAADYSMPKELMPLSIKPDAGEDGQQQVPSPRVIIHGVGE